MSTRMVRLRFVCHYAILGVIAVYCVGCGDVEWNWDTSWWKQPRRVVRPSQARPKNDQANANRKPNSDPNRDSNPDSNSRPVENTRPRVTENTTPSANENTPARVPSRKPVPTASLTAHRPFYQVYLCRAEQVSPSEDGEYRLKLDNVNGRACAALLEMLYIPLGRSGSEKESYLMYEEREEFLAAGRFAPLLDVPLQASDDASAFHAGVAQFLRIIEMGAVVEPNVIEACKQQLAKAAQSSDLPTQQRWAAAILAGRLVADYRYEYGKARDFYRVAAEQAQSNSLENMTARWWAADSFLQEGKFAEADRILNAIVTTYEDRWPVSQVIVKSKAALKEARKK